MKRIVALVLCMVMFFSVGTVAFASGSVAEEQYNRGVEYFERADYENALAYFLLSGQIKEYAPAQNMLGVCFRDGLGTEQNAEEAERYFKLAADQGYTEAAANLASLKENPEPRVKNIDNATTDELNQYALAYYEGNGVEKDYGKAFAYWEQSAMMGNMDAQFRVGFCYFYGIGVEEDYTESAKWFAKSAAQGEQGAQYNLGVMYENGFGVQQDYTKAVCYYQAAADQGNEFAQCNLAYCYLNGLGVEKDEYLAVYWYELAAEKGNELAIETLDNLFISAGDAVNTNGQISIPGDDFMGKMIDAMNSSLFLEKLPFDPLFSCRKSGADYIICYDERDLQRVSMWKDGSKMSGSDKFDTVMIECPCSIYEDMLCMYNTCVAAIFLTSPASVLDDAVRFYQELIVAASKTDDGEYSHAAMAKGRLSYSVEACVMDKEEDSWYYIFTVTEK